MKHAVLLLILIGALIIVTSLNILLVFTGPRYSGTKSEFKLVIDHDGGADDAMAIFMALLYETYFNGPKVIALTTTHGNVIEPQAFINTQKMLNVMDRKTVPIYRGSNYSLVISYNDTEFYFGHDGLGDNEDTFLPIQEQTDHAVTALINLSKKYEGKLMVAAIGPLTNIALAIKMDPQFINRIGQLYVGAGNIYSKDYPDPEFNILNDVEAYHVVSKNAKIDKVTVFPFSQVNANLEVTRVWREEVLGAVATPTMKALNSYERKSIETSDYWAMLDPAVMAAVLNSSIIKETKYSDNDVILCDESRGINTNVFINTSKSNVRLIYSAYVEVYKSLLMDIFSSELPKQDQYNILK